MLTGEDYLYHIPGKYSASSCNNCGLWFQNPRPKLSHLAKLYPSEYGPHLTVGSTPPTINPATASQTQSQQASWFYRFKNDMALRRRKRRRLRQQIRQLKYLQPLTPSFVPNGKVLEIGCATGTRLMQLRTIGWQDITGIELVPDAAACAKTNGFTVHCGTVEDVLPTLSNQSFDAIIASFVLEHCINPFAVVSMVADKLKPGGEFLFSTVVRNAIDARIYGRYWGGYDFPRHMIYFSLADIDTLLRDKFIQVKRIHENAPIDFVRSATWRNRPVDRIVRGIASSHMASPLTFLLARAGLTCRVSYRCRHHE